MTMKKVIAFVILLTLPLGFLLGAHKSVDALQDDVRMEVYPVYGDPSLAEGKTFQILSTCGEHMWWDIFHTPGDPGVTQTKFHFSQEGHGLFDLETEWSEFSLHSTNGMGMSSSGGTGLTFENKAVGILINAVAEMTLPGDSREETLRMEDYFEYYPLEYWVHFETKDYYVDESYDSVRNIGTMNHWEEEPGSSYQHWMERFRFPIVPGDTMTVSVGKDETGAIRNVGINPLGEETPYIYFTAIHTEKGLYFSPVFQTRDGEPMETGEFIYGYGLYYIPFKPVENIEGTPTWMTFDFDNLEMVYSLAPTDQLIAMEENEDATRLHMLTKEGDQYIYCLFDIPSRKLLSRTEILNTGQEAKWSFYPEEGLLFVIAEDSMALVRMGEDSRVEFAAPWPEEVEWVLPERVLYENGILYGVSQQWHADNYGTCLTVCSEEGLGYLGYYNNTLNGVGYNSYWFNIESVEFVK